MFPTCFCLYRQSSWQYFTGRTGNYMSYIQLKRLLCEAVRNVKTIKCVGIKRLKY
jgi:hypothetical protein